ncbi:GNAT family N-acetyltransferase [Wukongibacter baidiensis]|uniref:GNAT family N-acetyltransferase n=1 Tax=Wukongibacter baidiensis TaxID=1723361 RepID=UPI003D7F9359
MKIETERLLLRELKMDDVDDLHIILSDPESMKHYPQPYSLEKSEGWVKWNMNNYATYGFGIWAVILKEENKLIGDCGITMQTINGKKVPEIGYHINKKYTQKGYATEAARACRDYAFNHLGLEKVYSYMKYTNKASSRVAEKNGMTFIMEYEDDVNTITKVYAITREEYTNLKK